MPTETGTYYKQGPSVGKGMKKKLGRGNLRSTDNLLFNDKKFSNVAKRTSLKPLNRANPEAEKDFSKAYASLVQKMYTQSGQQISGLITEDEVQKVEHQRSLNEKQFLERMAVYQETKQAKLSALQEARRASEAVEVPQLPSGRKSTRT